MCVVLSICLFLVMFSLTVPLSFGVVVIGLIVAVAFYSCFVAVFGTFIRCALVPGCLG